MVSAINSAVSGFNASSKVIATSANNVANEFSKQASENGKPSTKPFIAQRVDQVSLSNGGVQTVSRPVEPPTRKGFDGSDQPNVSEDKELITQHIAAYNAKAELKAIKVQQNLDKALLDIKT